MSTPVGEPTPAFNQVLRGYARDEVDEYLEQLNIWADKIQQRADEAERLSAEREAQLSQLSERLRDTEAGRPTPPDEVVDQAAGRAAAALTQALSESDSVRRRAHEAADRVLGDANLEAVAIVDMARSGVAELTTMISEERRSAAERAQALLEETGQQCEQQRQTSDLEAKSVLAEATGEAKRIVAEAESAAEDTRRRNSAAEETAQASLARLHREREQIVGELDRLRGAIKALIADPVLAAGNEAGPVTDEGASLKQQAGAGVAGDVTTTAGGTTGSGDERSPTADDVSPEGAPGPGQDETVFIPHDGTQGAGYDEPTRVDLPVEDVTRR